jgi:hypothetical protein
VPVKPPTPSRPTAPAYGAPPPPGSAAPAVPGSPTRVEAMEPLLRATVTVAVVSAVLGLLVLPGLLGNVGERAVVWGERVTSTFTYVAFAGLLLLIGLGGYELIRRVDLGASRYAALALSVVCVGLASPAVVCPLMALAQVVLALAAAAFTLFTTARALRSVHTRAVAVVLGFVGLAGLFRALAWTVAAFSLASPGGYTFARVLSTLAVVLWGLAQLVAVAYFATRGKLLGRVLGNAALIAGFVATFLATRRPPSLAPVGAVLHVAFSVGASSPEPLGLVPIAYYLFPTGLALACMALLQRQTVGAVVGPLALALASQGRFDVPLAALSVTAGGMWLVLAAGDERALWSELIAARRLAADEAGGRAPARRPRDAEPKAKPEPDAPAPAAAEPAAPAVAGDPPGDVS